MVVSRSGIVELSCGLTVAVGLSGPWLRVVCGVSPGVRPDWNGETLVARLTPYDAHELINALAMGLLLRRRVDVS